MEVRYKLLTLPLYLFIETVKFHSKKVEYIEQEIRELTITKEYMNSSRQKRLAFLLFIVSNRFSNLA
jgi:hypothetical protein